MFRNHTRSKQLRGYARGATVALGAALMVLVGAGASLAQSSDCQLTISVNNLTDLKALQFIVDTSSAPGGFANDVTPCAIVPNGIAEVFVEDEDLEIAWADLSAFPGGGPFATCDFVSNEDPSTLVPGDLPITIVNTSGNNPPDPAVPAPTLSISVDGCVSAAPVCGNGVVESGEACDGEGCNGTCSATTGSCAAAPLVGCRQAEAGKAKVQFKDNLKDPLDNSKDQGQYQWKKGAATSAADFKDPVGGSATYSWCNYDDGVLIGGHDIPAGGTCDGKPCWKLSGKPEAPKGFQYKSKNGDAAGVGQLKMKAGDAGKAQIQVKAKSKIGNYVAPTMPLTTPVTSQVVIDDGSEIICFDTVFATPKKNEPKQFQAQGP